jgi:hypothetical protein
VSFAEWRQHLTLICGRNGEQDGKPLSQRDHLSSDHSVALDLAAALVGYVALCTRGYGT